MSKKNGTGPITLKTDGRKVQTYTTPRGRAITILPMPPMMREHLQAALKAEWEESGHPLAAKPTYAIKTAAGAEETHEHDEQSIALPEYAADKDAWQAWQTAEAEFDGELKLRTLKAVIIDCLEFEIDPAWTAKAKAKRMRVPADEWERKLFFAETELIGSGEDITAIIETAARLTGVDARLVDAAHESFRGGVEKTDAATPTEAQAG